MSDVLYRIKKVEDAITVLEKLQEFVPSATLTIVGDAPNALYSKSLLDKVQALGLVSESVVFTGKVSDSDLHQYYCNSDLFITMSEHEGFGIPVLEAIYFGLPVIVKSGSAAEKMVGDFGIIIQDITDDQIMERVVALAQNNAQKKHCKENGAFYVTDMLSKNNIEFWMEKIFKF